MNSEELADLRGKKVLIMGLGLLGGGTAAARWFVKHGASVTVTDLKSEEALAPSLKELDDIRADLKFRLGEHREEDFEAADIIVVNPGVPRESRFLRRALEMKKTLVNEALFFFNILKNPIAAVTGTKGKTTVTNWLAYFMGKRWPSVRPIGNSSDLPFFKVIDEFEKTPDAPVVAELSSWHLEFLDRAERGPDVAVITNLKEDHLNRYSSMEEYAKAKANIFKNQNDAQSLILNADDDWTKFFMSLGARSNLYFFSKNILPEDRNGVYVGNGILFRKNANEEMILSKKEADDFAVNFGIHNLENFLAASLAANLMGVPWETIRTATAAGLPQVRFREERIFLKNDLEIINDSTATSPEAAIAAIKRFSGFNNLILIAGGTDKNLSYEKWAKEAAEKLGQENVYLLNGSATRKMAEELDKVGWRDLKTYESLEEIMRAIRDRETKGTILFSPGAASFEKFKNEFDRGEKFGRIAKELFC